MNSVLSVTVLMVFAQAVFVNAVVKDTLSCKDEEIAPKGYDKCWSLTLHDHKTNKQSKETTCCPNGYVCCEGLPKNSRKPPCCPFGSECKEDGTCVEIKKYAECIAWGDPHYTTLDELKIDYQGTCRMLLAESKPGSKAPGKFQIYGRNEHRKPFTNEVAFIGYIEIVVGASVYRLQRDPAANVPYVLLAPGPVPADFAKKGKKLTLPYSDPNGVTIKMLTTPPNTIYLSTSFGVTIEFGSLWSVKIYIPDSFKAKVAGFCGNYDGNTANDLTLNPFAEKTKGVFKRAAVSALAVGNSYVVHDSEPSPKECVAQGPMKTQPPWHKLIIIASCGVIYEKDGPFHDCVPKIDAKVSRAFYEDCLFDGAQIGYSSICQNLKLVVDYCQEHQLPMAHKYEPQCDFVGIDKCF